MQNTRYNYLNTDSRNCAKLHILQPICFFISISRKEARFPTDLYSTSLHLVVPTSPITHTSSYNYPSHKFHIRAISLYLPWIPHILYPFFTSIFLIAVSCFCIYTWHARSSVCHHRFGDMHKEPAQQQQPLAVGVSSRKAMDCPIPACPSTCFCLPPSPAFSKSYLEHHVFKT